MLINMIYVVETAYSTICIGMFQHKENSFF